MKKRQQHSTSENTRRHQDTTNSGPMQDLGIRNPGTGEKRSEREKDQPKIGVLPGRRTK